MDSNFNTLLNRYIENQATPEEEAELMRLMRDAANREQAERYFDSLLKEPADIRLSKQESDEIRAEILKKIRPAEQPSPWRSIWMIAASLVIAASAVGFWLYLNRDSSPQAAQIAEMTYEGRDFITLPDSTTVMLNNGSELRVTYSDDRREISLVGEAYFDVTHDPDRPFYVRSGKLLTEVLGTAFSVRAYPGQKEYTVAVTRGKVSVSDAAQHRAYGVIMPDQQISVNRSTDAVVKTSGKDSPLLAWRNEFLVFNDLTMAQAAALLHERYQVNITFKNPALAQCQFNAKFVHNESVTTILDIITSALGLSYTTSESGDVVIDGKGCN